MLIDKKLFYMKKILFVLLLLPNVLAAQLLDATEKLDLTFIGSEIFHTSPLIDNKKGTKIKRKYQYNPPSFFFKNKSQTQFVRFMRWPLGHPGCIAHFEVGYISKDQKTKRYKEINDSIFVTNNGVKLGMDTTSFLDIRLSWMKKVETNSDTVHYQVFRPSFAYNGQYSCMSKYIANYYFYKNELVKFNIGSFGD